jgi:hypothetical protein
MAQKAVRREREVEEGAAPRSWIGVVSQSHVARGVAGGFAQLCHGKGSPLARMRRGDYLIYYSPSTDFRAGAQLRAFTAFGCVAGDEVYPYDMGGGFVPLRRDVRYLAARAVPLAQLAGQLHFSAPGSNWGMLARRGHFPIDDHDSALIAAAMGCAERVAAG